MPQDNPPPPKPATMAIDVGEVLDDFETGRGVARDEGVIFKGVDEGAVHGGMGALAEGLPALIPGSFDHFAAETADGVELGLRGGFDHEDFRGDAGAASGEGYALGSVAGADGPDAAAALVFGEKADGVPGSANFEGADGLQALQLEIDFGGAVVVEADERSADGGLVDVLARLIDEVGWNVSLGGWSGEWCWMGGHCEVHYTLVGGGVCHSEGVREECRFGPRGITEEWKSDIRLQGEGRCVRLSFLLWGEPGGVKCFWGREECHFGPETVPRC